MYYKMDEIRNCPGKSENLPFNFSNVSFSKGTLAGSFLLRKTIGQVVDVSFYIDFCENCLFYSLSFMQTPTNAIHTDSSASHGEISPSEIFVLNSDSIH